MALITETGEYIVWDPSEQKEKIVRDFTEIGYDSIYETYSFVEERLRTYYPNDKTE
jgi:predicted ATPase